MKKKLLTLLAISIAIINVSAQVPVPQVVSNFGYDVAATKASITSGFSIVSYDGSPFLYEKWADGIVTWNSGKTEEHQLNLFILNDKFIARQAINTQSRNSSLFGSSVNDEKDSIFIFDFTAAMHSIRIGEHLFVQVDFEDTSTVMEQLYGDNTVLLKRYTIDIRKGNSGSGYTEPTNPRFIQKDKLYYSIGNSAVLVLPTSKSKFYAIFRDKADAIKKYVKDNRLKIKEEEDIKKIFEYYDSL